MTTISALADGPFATYNLGVGPYNALLGIFNPLTALNNVALNFTDTSQTVTGVTTVDMAIGCSCFSRSNVDSTPMTANSPWPTVTGLGAGSFDISSPAIQTGSGYAIFSLINDGNTGVGHYTVSMTFGASFPTGTQWDWNFPNEYQSGVYGYPDLCYGQGAPGYYPVAPLVPKPKHPADFNDLLLSFAATATTTNNFGDDIDCLIETWVTNMEFPKEGTAPGIYQNEIGFLAYCPPTLWAYIQTLPHNFSSVIAGYSLYVATRAGTPGTSVPPFTLIVPTTPDFSTPVNLIDGNIHVINFGAILKALVADGLVSNTNWVVGYAFGPEIYQNSGTMTVTSFNWVWDDLTIFGAVM